MNCANLLIRPRTGFHVPKLRKKIGVNFDDYRIFNLVIPSIYNSQTQCLLTGLSACRNFSHFLGAVPTSG